MGHTSPLVDSSVQATPHNKGPKNSGKKLLILGVCGILAPMFIVVATVVGGWLRRHDYNHVRDAISRLYETDAPNAAWLMVLFTAYHALVIPLAYGLHLGLARGSKCKFPWLGPALLASVGVLGIPLGSYARCYVGCWNATTFRGKLHGTLVLATVPLVLMGMLSIWMRIRRVDELQLYANYTFGDSNHCFLVRIRHNSISSNRI